MLRSSHWIHAAAVTVLVLAFVGLMKLFTLRFHFLDPFSSRLQDYEVTDILFSHLRDTARIEMEPRIVMVHVEDPDRGEIATLLEKIGRRNPRVVGIDILFPGEKDSSDDARLARSIQSYDNIVLAANLKAYDPKTRSVTGLLRSNPVFADQATNAYTNFVAKANRTVRLFSPWLRTADGDRHPAFATAIAERYDPNAVRRLQVRNRNTERINFVGDYRSFVRIDAADVLEASDEDLRLFNDRIVLIGFADSRAVDAPLEDRYFTPLNRMYTGRAIPDMYGMTIHANIITMILRGNYIYDVPRWLVFALTLVVTFLNVLVIQRLYHRLPETFHGMARLLQLAEALVFFFLAAVFFSAFSIKLDLGLALLAMLIVYDFVMIYENLVRKRVPYLKSLPYD